ncbi:MAG: hypothetical protein JST04_03890 [Bdellovibrionales bacterium]|nr:hypothetical protein [Bdellovibrionales bacterium]
MRFAKQTLVLASVLLFFGSTVTVRFASAEETAPAKPAVTETKTEKKSEHCAKCHEKHAVDCGKSCPDCKKGSCAKCDHCKGEKDCSKCTKCHEGKDAEKSAKTAVKRATAIFHAAN